MCRALDDCSGKDQQALADRMQNGKAFAYVRRQVSPEQARRVAALGLDGIGFLKESRRFYPNRALAAHLLGYVGIDNAGLAGIEGVYDSLIRGQQGKVLVQVDARKQAFLRVERPPTMGATLELTIDQNIQHIVERELKAGVEWANAAGGSAIVMDPATGEVLAMASYPTFNPNVYREAKDNERRNRPVQDLYEPGSTFKIITASAALEEHVVKPTDLVDVSTGYDQLRLAHHPRRSPLRRPHLPAGGGEVEQRRLHQGRSAARLRALRRLRAAGSASDARSRPTSAARTPASCGTGPR